MSWMVNKLKSGKYLYKRGVHYERQAKKELEKSGYLVIRSSGSHGIFDIWALNDKELKLIQCKAVKKSSNFTKLTSEIKKIKVPPFCSKELWIWIDRKGWRKIKCQMNKK